eukprot:TRINITY_DN295_c0_g1_i1.p1 TRINITY_DN295_c0_g1~~TRINITY_DN295_c0_g1_i1.p1  ORF type:complete len:100 (-),score=13.63 TRINITY_DN295_c0_g1_i1:439-693(-)
MDGEMERWDRSTDMKRHSIPHSPHPPQQTRSFFSHTITLFHPNILSTYIISPVISRSWPSRKQKAESRKQKAETKHYHQMQTLS